MFCLFNLKAYDTTMSRRGISFHWGVGLPPLAWTEDMIYTTDIYLWVSHGETQYPHSKFLTGQWRSERESKAQPYLEFQNYDWLKKGWFEEWPKYFWHDPEHVGVTAQIQVSAVRKGTFENNFLEK